MCASLLGDATEHLYQLNHVYVTLPTKEANIKTKDDRLFTRLDVWDVTKKITVAFRSKAMLQLASLQNDQDKEYEQLLATDELRHPVLVSLRLLLQSKPEKPEQEATATEHSQTQADNKLSAVVVEVEPCTFTDIPDDSVDAIHGLVAGTAQTSERLAAVPLDKLRPSPFYNMLADGKPVEKALTLLHFTQRSNGKQHARVPHHHRAHPRCHCRCCYRAHQRELLCRSSAVHGRESPRFFSREGRYIHGRDLQGGCTIQTSTAHSRSLHRGHGTCQER